MNNSRLYRMKSITTQMLMWKEQRMTISFKMNSSTRFHIKIMIKLIEMTSVKNLKAGINKFLKIEMTRAKIIWKLVIFTIEQKQLAIIHQYHAQTKRQTIKTKLGHLLILQLKRAANWICWLMSIEKRMIDAHNAYTNCKRSSTQHKASKFSFYTIYIPF